jgi:hypothetical protein
VDWTALLPLWAARFSFGASHTAKANSLSVYSESMLSWPFFLKKNGTRRKSPLRTIREFALGCFGWVGQADADAVDATIGAGQDFEAQSVFLDYFAR